jgi:hypothetical protein
MAKAKVQTIDKQDLEQLRQALGALNQIKGQIGGLEIQKADALSSYMLANQQFSEMQKALEFKYGKVSIDIKTGTYEEIKEDENGAAPKA